MKLLKESNAISAEMRLGFEFEMRALAHGMGMGMGMGAGRARPGVGVGVRSVQHNMDFIWPLETLQAHMYALREAYNDSNKVAALRILRDTSPIVQHIHRVRTARKASHVHAHSRSTSSSTTTTTSTTTLTPTSMPPSNLSLMGAGEVLLENLRHKIQVMTTRAYHTHSHSLAHTY